MRARGGGGRGGRTACPPRASDWAGGGRAGAALADRHAISSDVTPVTLALPWIVCRLLRACGALLVRNTHAAGGRAFPAAEDRRRAVFSSLWRTTAGVDGASGLHLGYLSAMRKLCRRGRRTSGRLSPLHGGEMTSACRNGGRGLGACVFSCRFLAVCVFRVASVYLLSISSFFFSFFLCVACTAFCRASSSMSRACRHPEGAQERGGGSAIDIYNGSTQRPRAVSAP